MAKSVGKGVREKLRRAHMHRKDFERRVERFINTDAYRAVRQDDVKAGKRLWIAQVHKRPPDVRWGALIGECLFSFRSALDHLAFDLALAYSKLLTPKQERDSAFPINWRSAPTKADLDRRIGAVHPKARDLIETMQPYDRKDRAALKYLDSLCNYDKHRTLHTMLGVSRGVTHFGDMDFDFVNFSPFEHGDVLASIPLTSDPERQQDPNIMFGVAFRDDGPGAGYEVTLMLRWIGQHIEKGVIEPLLPYL